MNPSGERIAVIGAGYVGLTTGVCLGHLGHRVVIADADPGRVAELERGVCPLYEAGLERLMHSGVDRGLVSFVRGAAGAVEGARFVYICVPTPQSSCGAADLSFVESAVREIAPKLDAGVVVINKSTVPVGSGDKVSQWLNRPDVAVVSNPEFLREGSAVHDFLNPDRIVIGASDRDAALRVAALYLDVAAPVIVTDRVSAELAKYASNAFLATKVSFVNEVATLCDLVGADSVDVMAIMGADPRIGRSFLKPGPGWGGSCFPKDTRALEHMSECAGHDFELLKDAIVSNERQADHVMEKIRTALGGDLVGSRIGVLGLSFKAGTADLRDSPALSVTDRLIASGAEVSAHDPAVVVTLTPSATERLAGMRLVDDPVEAAKDAEVVVLLTEWDCYRDLDLAAIAHVMSGAALVDTRNLLDPEDAGRCGLDYIGTGRRHLLADHSPFEPASV